jgi:DNA-binding transcriptional LysR family regulator
MKPRISLEHWRTLIAIVDFGGYAQAAAAVHKTQSSVTYAVNKIEADLGVKVFEIQGRRAVLTEAGQVVHRRAKQLIGEATLLEQSARAMAGDWKPVLKIAVDIAFPTQLLLRCLKSFAQERPQTHIELYESVIGGTEEAVRTRQVDLAICCGLPNGMPGDLLLRQPFVAAAHPDHSLHLLGRVLDYSDLARYRHLLIRETGTKRKRASHTVDSQQIWTVSNMATSIRAATMGMGFAWYPIDFIRNELASGALKVLPLVQSAERFADLYLVLANRDYASPDERRLAKIICETASGAYPLSGNGQQAESAGGS